MKSWRKILSVLLALIMVLLELPWAVFAHEVARSEDLTVDYQSPVLATQSRTSGFSKNFTLSGDGKADMVAVALAQENRTGADFGYTEEWCADFVGDCAILAQQDDVIPLYGGVSGLYDRILAAGGKVTTSDPQPGDICFIDWNGGTSMGHVEIVYAVSDNSVSTIGGNSGSGSTLSTRCVKKHSPLSPNYIVSIVRPAYCEHDYIDLGVCAICGEHFDWESTCSTEENGIYNVVKGFWPRTDMPYDAAEKSSDYIEAGDTVAVTGRFENAHNNYWYRFEYDNGEKIGYVYADGYLEYDSPLTLEVVCNDFSPADGAVLEKKAQPVIGKVTSNYPLSAIYAYLDGSCYSSWHAPNKSTTEVSLRETDINYDLDFASLADGKHTIELIAHSFWVDYSVHCHASEFYINEKDDGANTYTISYDANGGTNAPSSQTKEHGVSLILSTQVPDRVGYSFAGWATSAADTSSRYHPGDEFTMNEDTTLYARWESAVDISTDLASSVSYDNINFPYEYKTYSYTPSVNGKIRVESEGEKDTLVYLYDAQGDLLAWDDDSGADLNFMLTYPVVTGEKYYIRISFYGADSGSFSFTMRRVYDVVYDANGGSGAPGDQEKVDGLDLILSSEVPTRYGCEFYGWATDEPYTSANYQPGDTYRTNSSVTLYAVWQCDQTTTVYFNAPDDWESCNVYWWGSTMGDPEWPGESMTMGAKGVWRGSIPSDVLGIIFNSGSAQTEDLTLPTDGKTLYDSDSGQWLNYGQWTEEMAGELEIPQIQYCYSKKQTSVRVQWEEVDGVDGYELYRSTSPDDLESFQLVKTISDPSVTTYTNQGLTEGVTYYYRICSYVGQDLSTRIRSSLSEVSHIPAAVVWDAPYSNSSFRIRLRWAEVGGCHGYQIWRKDEGGEYRVVKTIGDRGNELTNDQGGTTAYSNVGLTAGAKYTYKMRAFYITEDGGKVFGPYSDEVTVAVQPAAPEITVTSPKAGRARVDWTMGSAADGYQVWMSESPDSGFAIVKSVTDGTAVSYTKYSLESGKTYYFKVRAYAEVDGKKTFGAYSETIAVTVK